MKPNSILKTFAQCLLLISTAMGIYLSWVTLANSGEPVGCGDSTNCSTILSSQWSHVLGLPVALIGSCIYLAAALLPARDSSRLQAVRLSLLITIPLAAIWFFALQFLVIGQFCTWCCSTHLTASVGALLLIKQCRFPKATSNAQAIAAATAAIATLATTQALTSQSAHKPNSTTSAVAVYDFSTSPSTHENLTVLNGNVSFNPQELPKIGNENAEKIAYLLGDYTCPHCRHLTSVLQAVEQAYSGQLAIVKLPATRSDTESAEIHRYMLALWKADKAMYHTLDQALVEQRISINAAAVRTEASRLIGAGRFADACAANEIWINEQLTKTRTLQDANRATTGKSMLPQVIIGTELLMGSHSDPDFYANFVNTQLGLNSNSPIAHTSSLGTISLKNNIADVGEVWPGKELPFSVEFMNRDAEPLAISWLNMGAYITLAKFDRKEIAPGDSSTINFILTVPDDAPVGKLDRHITIHSSSGQAPKSFQVIGNILPRLATTDLPDSQ